MGIRASAAQQVDLDEIRLAEKKGLALAEILLPSLRPAHLVRRREDLNARHQPRLRFADFVDVDEGLLEIVLDERPQGNGLGFLHCGGGIAVAAGRLPFAAAWGRDLDVRLEMGFLLLLGFREDDVRS